MSYFDFRAVTTGEHLFKFVVNDVCQTTSLLEIQSIRILAFGGRSDFLAEYFLGASAMNILARCIKKSERIRSIEDEADHHPRMVRYIQQSLGMAKQDDELVDKLARLSLQAAGDSKRPIKDNVKRIVRNGRSELPCYLCGALCQLQPLDPKEAIEYEHIWPASFGGSSSVDNLLPACWACNRAKDDMLLWHTGHLFSFVLKPDPSQEELKSISRREKIAAQFRKIFNQACTDRIDLKAAAQTIGPVDMNSIYAIDSDDAMDFSNFEFR